MGCDIHAHAEVKVSGKWHHYSVLDIDRDYQLFGKLAGVRDSTLGQIAPLRGLPDDASFLTIYDHDDVWGSDAHSTSWLTIAEAMAVDKWLRELRHEGPVFDGGLWGYVFGNSFDCCIKYPEDAGCEDARVVFWFDGSVCI